MKHLLLVLSMVMLIFNLAGLTWTVRLSGDGLHDGWLGESLDLSVNGVPVLSNLTLVSGSGPESHSFEVSPGDQITADCTNYCFANQQNIHRYAIYDHNLELVTYRGYPQPLHEPMDISYPITVKANPYVIEQQIGTGTANQSSPMGPYWGFERSAAIYTFEQLGTLGTLEQISWYCSVSSNHSVPYKIYVKSTPATAMTPIDWATMVSGATLVKQGTHTFSSLGWHTFSLDVPFYYSSDNLAILVEVNFGGNGLSYPPKFNYTTSTTGSHQNWYANYNPPLSVGTTSNKRPNIILRFSPLPGDPAGTFSPASWDFGNLPLTNTADQTFTLTNSGGGILRTTGIHIAGWPGAEADYYSQTNPHALNLFSGQSATLTVAYHPGSVGPSIGQIAAQTNTGSWEANLFGSGWDASPQASVDPQTWDYGGVDIYTTDTKLFLLTNSGAGSLNVSDVVVVSDDPGVFTLLGSFTPQSLLHGQTVELNVVFSPRSELNSLGNPLYTGLIEIYVEGAVASSVSLSGACNDTSISSFPYREGFESSTFPPQGWANVKTAGSTNPGTWNRVLSGANPTCNPYSGTAMARYYSYYISAGGKAELISPPLNLPADDFRIEFYMYRDTGASSNAEAVNIYYNTSNQAAGGTLLGTVHRNLAMPPAVATAGWHQYTFTLPAGSAGLGRYIIFEGVSTYGNNIFIDEIIVQQIPSAPLLSVDPLAVDFGAVALDSSKTKVIELQNIGIGTLSVTDALFSSNPDDEFSLEPSFSPVQLAPGQRAILTLKFSPSAILSGGNTLHTGTLDIYTDSVHNLSISLSGSSYDPWITAFPWTETFEDDSQSRNDWTQIQEAGVGLWTFAAGVGNTAPAAAHTGTLNARFVSVNGTNSPITKLVTPVLDLSGLTDPQVQFFYAQGIWDDDQNHTKVYYRTNASAPWIEIAHFTDNVTAWTEVNLALPEPSSTYQIAFEGINNWGHANGLDDVCVRSVPEPPPPPPPPPLEQSFALNFASGAYAYAPYISAYNTASLTLEMWFRTDVGGNAVEFLCGRAMEQMEIHLGGGNPNSIRFIPTTAVYLDTQANVIVPGEWNHLACVYAPSQSLAKIYLNGVDLPVVNHGPNPITTPISLSTREMRFGIRGDNYFSLDGALDEIRIWKRALTAEKIRLHMHLYRTGSESDLIGYWRLDEATGSSAADLCGRSNLSFSNLNENDWLNSPVPIGAGSSQLLPIPPAPGTLAFPDQGLEYDLDSAGTGELCVYQVNLSGFPEPAGYDAIHDQPAWIVRNFGGSSLSGNSHFTAPDFFQNIDAWHPDNTKLLRRDIVSTSEFAVYASAQEVNPADHGASFPAFTGPGLYILAKTQAVPATPLCSIAKSASPGFIQLAWDLVPGADWYGVYVADSPDAEFGPEYGNPDYVVNSNFINLPASSYSKRFFRISAGTGTIP